MISNSQVAELNGVTVLDPEGDRIGKVDDVYLDNDSGVPEWVSVNTGFLGSAKFVPLEKATFSDGSLQVHYAKALVKDAPRIDGDEGLSPQEERSLYDHYSIDSRDGLRSGTFADVPVDRDGAGVVGEARADVDRDPVERSDDALTPAAAGTTGAGSHDDIDGGAITRSEEKLSVGTETRETGRARLRKYVVTETQQVDVPVSHEEVRIEREPITEDARVDDITLGDDEQEVVLHEEVPRVDKHVEAVERVRLGAETVTGTEHVEEDVAREEIDVDRGTARAGGAGSAIEDGLTRAQDRRGGPATVERTDAER